MSRQRHNPNRDHDATDPLFELLADEPVVQARGAFKSGLRDQLMSFPALAGLITFHVPGIGRVFVPRLIGVVAVAAVGAGMALLLALLPAERAAEPIADRPDARPVQVQDDRATRPLEVPAAVPPVDEAAASDRAAAALAFDPPRVPVVIGAVPPVGEASEPVAAIGAGAGAGPAIVPAAPAPVDAPPEPPVGSSPPDPDPVQGPRDRGDRGGPNAPQTPVPTSTPAPTGGDIIELPPTATPWPTSEGRPTLPPAFPTDTPPPSPPPSKTPEPSPTPAP